MKGETERTIEYLIQHPQVSSAWVFGSVARGCAGFNSDIDIGILFNPGLSKYVRFDLRLAIGIELSQLLRREADVIDIQEAPLFLQHQVRKMGKLIVEKDHSNRVSFEVRSRQEYFDLAPVLNRRNQTLVERVLGGKNIDG